MRKIWIMFDIENWLWKSEIGNCTRFRAGVDLPFDAEVAEKT